jgi:hypothetical protein
VISLSSSTESKASTAPSTQRNLNLSSLLDVVSVLCVDYVALATGPYVPWLRIVRFCKLHRLLDIDALFRSLFKSYNLYNVVRLALGDICAIHIFACILYPIAKSEYEKGGRFDGKSFVLLMMSQRVVQHNRAELWDVSAIPRADADGKVFELHVLDREHHGV